MDVWRQKGLLKREFGVQNFSIMNMSSPKVTCYTISLNIARITALTDHVRLHMGKAESLMNTYQLAGLDDRERGFNRQVKVSERHGSYQAMLRYETLRLEGAPCETDESALRDVIRTLHDRGYTQLRSQLIFRGNQYLGSQELWVDYPDPEPQSESGRGLMRWLRCFFTRPPKV